MARTKRPPTSVAPFEDTLAAQLASAAMSTSWMPTTNSSSPINCTACNIALANMSASEIEAHITTCDQTGTSSGTQAHSQSHNEFESTTESRDHVRSITSTSAEPTITQAKATDESAESSSRLTTPPESPFVRQPSEENSVADLAELNDNEGSDGGDQLDDEEEDDLKATSNNAAAAKDDIYSSLTPFVGDELEYYDFDEVTEAPAGDANLDEASEFLGEPQDQQNADAEDASEAPEITRNVSEPQDGAVPAITLQAPETNAGDVTPEPLSTQASDTFEDPDADAFLQPSTSKVKRYGFPKLTPLEDFEEYLTNPEDMSYEVLYHRTAVVANALVAYQKEFKNIDQEVKDFARSKLPTKEKKQQELEDKARLEEEKDVERWRLYDLYYAKVEALMESSKSTDPAVTEGPDGEMDENADEPEKATTTTKKPNKRAWETKAKELLQNYPNENEDAAKTLSQFFVGNTLKEMRERRDGPKLPLKPVRESKASKLNLIEVPYPDLGASERATYAARQSKPVYEDLEAFEMRKIADVYGLPMKAGTVDLKDRNAVDEGDPDENENGRPKRNRNKPTTYETEQSETQGDSSEELPAKRRRTQTSTAPINGSPSRARAGTATRDGSPAPRTFASGKRIGRPPGSKTKAKPAKSKLQQSHLPPASESETPEASQSHTQELPAKEEAQLQEAAHALVTQTTTGQDVPAPPKKGKHGGARIKGVKGAQPAKPKPARGGRAKKELAAEEEVVDTKPKKGGRGKKAATQKIILPNVDGDEVFQSTEQDDESRFASASTSRPSTSSSAATATTLGSRRATRQSTREQSKVHGETVNGDSPNQNRGAPAKGKGKRKRGLDGSQESGIVLDQPEVAEPVRKKRKYTRKVDTKVKSPTISPEANGDASAPASGRQKRKRAPTITQDSIQVALPDQFEEEYESTPPASKRRKGGKTAAAQASSDPHGVYESTPPPTKASGRRKKATAKAALASQSQSPSQPKKARPGRILILQYAPPQSGPVAASDSDARPTKRGRNAKGKSVKEESTESEYVSGDVEETGPKTRKSRPVTRRKNQRAEDVDSAESSEPVPSRKTSRIRKTKSMVEPDTDIDELQTDEEVTVKSPPSRQTKAKAGKQVADIVNVIESAPKKQRGGRKAKTEAAPEPDYEVEEFGTEDEVDIKSRTPKTKANKKGKGIEMPPPELAAEGEDNEAEMNEAELKAKQKSAKLSAATRARWASGKMVGPMQKRQATNEAKKAARLAAKAAQGDGSAPIQPASATIVGSSISAPPAPSPKVPAPISVPTTNSASSSATRTSGRKRKPTSRAMGLDGADDSSSDEQPTSGNPFKSEYEHFQALSSPGTPALGKRHRRSLYDLSAAMVSEDDDEF